MEQKQNKNRLRMQIPVILLIAVLLIGGISIATAVPTAVPDVTTPTNKLIPAPQPPAGFTDKQIKSAQGWMSWQNAEQMY